MISGFRCKGAENCALLGYNTGSSGNFYRLSFGFLNPEDGTIRLSRNVGKKLPLVAA
jgi:hypothetical protein